MLISPLTSIQTGDTTYYEVNLVWDIDAKGTLNSAINARHNIDEKTPPNFRKSVKEKWNAEHLFVASVSSCLMSTFLLVADNSKLDFLSFESNAIGTIELIDGKLEVTEILLTPKLVLPPHQKETKAKKVLQISEKACAIINFIKAKITLEPIIIIT